MSKEVRKISKCSKRLSIWDKDKQDFIPIDGVFCGYEDLLSLDESFDSGKLEFIGSSYSEPITPMTPIRIEYAENDGTLTDEMFKINHVATEYYLATETFLAQDTFFKNKPNTFRHRIKFVELTYQLACEVCDTLTFTNKLGHIYDSNAKEVIPNNIGDSGIFEFIYINKNNDFKSPILTDGSVVLEIASPEQFFKAKIVNMPFVNAISGEQTVKIYLDNDLISTKAGFLELNNINSEKILKIEYCSFFTRYESQEAPYFPIYYYKNAPFSVEYSILIKKDELFISKQYYTISEVLKRIVEVGVTRRVGEAVRYQIDDKVLEKYKKIRAPEFHMTRYTLFEALLEVGKYVHAIPRLVWNEQDKIANIITFDELGGSSEWIPSECDVMSGYNKARCGDEYCGAYDSAVENLINTTNEAEATIQDVIKTTRTESAKWLVENDSAIIMTDRPIYRLISLKVKDFIHNWETEIIPYVFESAEYGTLSGFDAIYPRSKCYALTYQQGDRRITGLEFIRESLTSISFATEGALTNILVEKMNISKDNISSYKDLAFSVTYIPITSARVVQKKAYEGDFDLKCTRIYNQQTNTVESNYYGEHIKGIIAMLGNKEEFRRYQSFDFNNWPKLGQLLNGMYIYNIMRNILSNDCIEFNLKLVENYNKLNEFYGLKSNFRMFEISEKQSIDRAINYGEDIFIGTEDSAVTQAKNVDFALKDVAGVLKNTLLGKNNTSALTAIAQGFANNNNEIGVGIQKPVIKSLITAALGNSIVFNYSYDDNYSAGVKVESYKNSNKYSQKLVPYGDNYGELYYLKLHILKDKDSSNLSEAMTAPEVEYDFADNAKVVFDYATKPLIIRKDSRECLNITTQVNFIAKEPNIVIGRLLCLRNYLVNVNSNFTAPHIVLLPYKVNMLNNYLDLSEALDIGEFGERNFDTAKLAIQNIRNASANAYKAWAIVDIATGEYYLAVNEELLGGETAKIIKFTY